MAALEQSESMPTSPSSALPYRPHRPLLGALLSLALTACGNPEIAQPASPAPQTVQISGNVVLPEGALAAAWNVPHVAGELLVSTSNLSAQSLNTALVGLQSQRLSELGLIRVWTADPQQLATKLAASGIASQPNYIYTAQALPNDPGFPGNAGIPLAGQRMHQDYLNQIAAAQAWADLEAQGQSPVGTLTAVLDTGVDRRHPDLTERLVGGFDFCSVVATSGTAANRCAGTDEDYSDIKTQPYGHGTAMTGMIGAAANNGVGLSGVTWSGPLLAVKVIGDLQGGNAAAATTTSLAEGLGYAIDHQARVINMSLGIPGLENDPAVNAQLQRAAAADITLIAAAGNTANQGLYFPANRPEVIAVGAVNRAGQMSCFSARPYPQQTLTLLAPGGESGCNRQAEALLELSPTGYQLGAGTSEAAALTSGAASLIRAAYPRLSTAQVRQALVQGGQPSDSAQPQLNVAGALKVARSLAGAATPPVTPPPVTPQPQPVPQPQSYTLTVQAYQNGQAVGEAFKQTAPLTALRLPYSLNVPQGTDELQAIVVTTKAIYSGSVAVNAATNMNQDIAVR